MTEYSEMGLWVEKLREVLRGEIVLELKKLGGGDVRGREGESALRMNREREGVMHVRS